MLLTGSEILVRALVDQGVETIFGYPGGTVLGIYDALHAHPEIRHVLASHEQGAAHAADGYARATGRTGVVLATSGPGATNLVTGIATAYLDSVPLVALTGNVPLDLLGRNSFQEVDATGITGPIVKRNWIVRRAEDIEGTVREAFAIAQSGRKGPVHIDIPKDVAAQQAEYRGLGRYELQPAPGLDDDALARAAEAIAQARRPLIYAGGGVAFSDASEALLALSERAGIPICVSMMGLSSVPKGYPLYLGMVGMHGTPSANLATRECDLLLAVGARFSDRVAGNRKAFARDARIVHIDIDAAELGKNVRCDIGVVADAGEALRALAERVPPGRNEAWTHRLLHYKAHNPLPSESRDGVTPTLLLRVLKDVVEEDAIIVTDVGQHQVFTALHYPFARPRTFLSSCGLGTMGYGLGAAIGAQIGNPGRQVVLVTGDGCFHMNMNEMAVAVTEGLPVVVLVMNNRVLGMVHQWQTLFYEKRYAATEIDRATDYVKLAEAFGGVGMRIERPEEAEGVLRAAMACGRPCVVDCRIDYRERVFPMIPPGGTQRDMIYSEDV